MVPEQAADGLSQSPVGSMVLRERLHACWTEPLIKGSGLVAEMTHVGLKAPEPRETTGRSARVASTPCPTPHPLSEVLLPLRSAAGAACWHDVAEDDLTSRTHRDEKLPVDSRLSAESTLSPKVREGSGSLTRAELMPSEGFAYSKPDLRQRRLERTTLWQSPVISIRSHPRRRHSHRPGPAMSAELLSEPL